MTQPAIELSPDARKEIAEALNQSVAETAVTTMLAQNFHWNVTGMAFGELHRLFQEIYEDHFQAQDDLAERIRALGFPAPGAYSIYARLSSIKEEEGVPSAEEMIKQLVAGQEAVTRTARGIFPLLDKVSDEPTADLLTQRMQVHEKTAWMLRSLLENQ